MQPLAVSDGLTLFFLQLAAQLAAEGTDGSDEASSPPGVAVEVPQEEAREPLYDPAAAGGRQPIHSSLEFMVAAFDSLVSSDAHIIRQAFTSVVENFCSMPAEQANGTSPPLDELTVVRELLSDLHVHFPPFLSRPDESVMCSLANRLTPSLSLLLDMGLPSRLGHSLRLFTLATRTHGWSNSSEAESPLPISEVECTATRIK